MVVSTTYPGVYVQEIPSGARTIVGVGTSIGLFVGRAYKGELNKPVQCLSMEDFERAFTSRFAGSDMARAVRLFFQNGGTNCYAVRIADAQAAGSTLAAASVQLQTEGKAPSLVVTARSPGTFGNDIRVGIDYNTPDPESSFNMEVFRWTRTSTGAEVKSDGEFYVGLSMNPASPRYVVDILQQQSKLVRLTDVSTPLTSTARGFSQAGRPIAAGAAGADLRAEVVALFAKSSRPSSQFRISVDGGPAQLIDLADLDFVTATAPLVTGFSASALAGEIKKLIDAKVSPATVEVDFKAGPVGQAGKPNVETLLLRIASGKGDVQIFPGPSPAADIASVLMLGTAQGGIEESMWAGKRPAPNGLVFNPTYSAGTPNYVTVAETDQSKVNKITIDGVDVPLGLTLSTTANPATSKITTPVFFQDAHSVQGTTPPDPVSDGLREKWNIIAAAIQSARANDPTFRWTAQVWGSRLAILPVDGIDNVTGAVTTAGGTNIGGAKFNVGTRYYSLGTTGTGAYQTNGAAGNDGGPPTGADYEKAYLEVDREVDLFNLLVLPKDEGHNDATTRMLWGPASLFCQRKRAFLLMDPPADWTGSQTAAGPTVGVGTLRIGLVKDHAAIFFPRLKINEGGREVLVGPSGAIAGLIGRIDGTRGVWKAPAGTEADLRGVTGLEYRFTDGENGVMNPKAINTIRVFPNGIVTWGARTMDGDDSFGSEYKYIPIRRLALYIQESLYRGITWVVFEPNDEPLWAQIRLNVGAFMNDLYRQGAFQGQTPKDAYFVKCDASTTTQNDRNLGIVNILVGFAPLKPAEFVVLTLQQMAGQIQT